MFDALPAEILHIQHQQQHMAAIMNRELCA